MPFADLRVGHTATIVAPAAVHRRLVGLLGRFAACAPNA
jgi:hypothetical protein